jgi:hypothetical protein
MEFASSLYRGGELIAASQGNHRMSRELGLICPFCKESVHFIKEYWRGNVKVSSAWRHYKIGVKSHFCENRALSEEGKNELKQLLPYAQRQRLQLFNRRFWEIFSIDKVFPKKIRQAAVYYCGSEETVDQLVNHCLERWGVEEILKVLPEQIKQTFGNKNLVPETLRKHPFSKDLTDEQLMGVTNELIGAKFTVLRFKILNEVVAWLPTRTARTSFEKLICLSIVDCAAVMPIPIHTQDIANAAVASLVMTNWERSIAQLSQPTKAIGFGVR